MHAPTRPQKDPAATANLAPMSDIVQVGIGLALKKRRKDHAIKEHAAHHPGRYEFRALKQPNARAFYVWFYQVLNGPAFSSTPTSLRSAKKTKKAQPLGIFEISTYNYQTQGHFTFGSTKC